MNREILFRGKRQDNKEWVEGMLGAYKPDKIAQIRTFKDFGTHIMCTASIPVYPSTVGQYTGLTDKNGKRIFEWDIVHCISHTDSGNMVVIFEDGEFRMVLRENYKHYITGGGFYSLQCFDKEVIGNVHDNKEFYAQNGEEKEE